MSYARKLVIATGNRKKGIEMAQILSHVRLHPDTPARHPERSEGSAFPRLEILTLADFPGVDADVEETGSTYAENAEIKARAAAEATGLVSIADDAGLEIDALDGRPGLYSKRFLGEETPFPEKMARIIEMLRDVPDDRRRCRFQCAVAIATPDGRIFLCDGICEGRIADEMRGSNGFGYDPIFYLPALGRHMAELAPDEKHRISHRGLALACAKEVLQRLFEES